MSVWLRTVIAGVAVCTSAAAWAQQARREPEIGYLYPAGGQRGTTVEIIAGGQFLRGADQVYIAGDGVEGVVIQHYPPVRNLNGDQRRLLQQRMRVARDARLAEQRGREPRVEPASRGPAAQDAPEAVRLPAHPLLDRVDNMSLRELEHLQHVIFNFGRRQLNAQIAELVKIEIAIDAHAAPGPRELRVRTAQGVSNPLNFDVNVLPEMMELEPNDPGVPSQLPNPDPLELPVLINGQILPGDIDRFTFQALEGQRLVLDVQARSLVPYLADAVPGWFQAVLTLFDPDGAELAFVDNFRFDPDPVLFFEIPEDGVYEVEIRDAIFRGREDFVYRLSISERPFIKEMFPLGARAGEEATARIDGWNLPADEVTLNTGHAEEGLRSVQLSANGLVSNRVVYAVDSLPETFEVEPNNSIEQAQEITLPKIVNGRIDEPGDVDVFAFQGRKDETIVAEVYGRRLRSPVDSLLRVTDASGNVLAWNDDYVEKDGHLFRLGGLLTHDADSYVRVKLPETGRYYVHVSDAQGQGGGAYVYRLRISAPQPDYALRVTPASLNIAGGLAAPVGVHVIRQDGFDGEIEVRLKDPPQGFRLHGGRIPPGRDYVRMTISAPARPRLEPHIIEVEGRAVIDGREVRRKATPADDTMQAFLYRHLAPAENFMAAVMGVGRTGGRVELADSGIVRIPEGGQTEVRVRVPRAPILETVQLELRDPPPGMVLEDLRLVPEGLAFLLKAEGADLGPGTADNLIVEASIERSVRRGSTEQLQRLTIGVLPAIPFEIVKH